MQSPYLCSASHYSARLSAADRLPAADHEQPSGILRGTDIWLLGTALGRQVSPPPPSAFFGRLHLLPEATAVRPLGCSK